jgi:Uma2 family endonuclease
MVALSSNGYFSPDDYLELESRSEVKHEYIDGQIYAMAGTGGIHNIISGNFYMALRSRLQNSGCRVYFADLKVKLKEGRRFYYPDLLVTCDERDAPSQAFVNFPRVIIEVLSESTEGFDRGKKFQDYRTLPSLWAYILVNAQQYLVECFQRTPQDFWLLKSYEGLEAIADIEALNLAIPLAEIYATLDLPALVDEVGMETDLT